MSFNPEGVAVDLITTSKVAFAPETVVVAAAVSAVFVLALVHETKGKELEAMEG